MNRIIDQDPPPGQYGRSSPSSEPVDCSNSQKNVQAPGDIASSADRWEFRSLNKSLNPHLSKLEREYWSWEFRNPDALKCPARYTPVFDAWERQAMAEDFRITTDPKALKIRRIKEDVDRDLPGFNQRRAIELLNADYIEREIEPLGPIEYQRGELSYFDEPRDIASRLRSCRKRGTIGIKPDGGRLIIFDEKCGFSKICPDESRAESQRLAERYIPSVDTFLKQHRGNTVQLMVPTLPNYPAGYLAAGKKEIFKMFRRLMDRKCFDNVVGCLIRQEDPLSVNGDWNVHLNVLLLISGPFDWKAVRKAWGYNVHFESAESMTQKTKAKLIRQGRDVSKMDNITMLTHAFNEVCKYSGAPITAKSASKAESGQSKAPPMTQWPAELWREWWAANKGFRRTRTYGVLYDPEGYRWGVAEEASRSVWVAKAGLDDELICLPWRKKEGSLKKDERDAIRDVMNEKEILDMSLVEWIGTVRYIKGEGYRIHLDLIPEDKLGDPDKSAWSACPNYPTGPPPDAPEGVDMVAAWDDYCNDII